MLLRVSLVILAISVVTVAHNVDDIVPEVIILCQHHNYEPHIPFLQHHNYESLILFPSTSQL